MGGADFDRLSHRVTYSRRHRRHLLQLLGGALGVVSVSAGNATAKRKRKKRCRKNGQTCVNIGGPVGKCCKHSSCQEVPYDQSKFCLCKPGYWDPNRTGHCSPLVCQRLQGECSTAEICCQDQVGGGATCAAIANNKGPRGCGFLTGLGTTSRCCLGEGGSICTGDCDCCADLTCQGGRCRPPQPVCLEMGASCTSDVQCCGGNTDRADCTFVDPFKGPFGCGLANQTTRCCTTEGWECEGTCDCCGSMICINGTCGYTQPGQECLESSQCQAGTCQVVQPKHDNSCLIPANQPPPRLCCLGEGGECGTSCQCCGTLTCQDSACSSLGVP